MSFIEFMDVGTFNDWNLAKVVSASGALLRRLHPRAPDHRGAAGDVPIAAGGINLRGPLRAGESDDELRERIAGV